MSAEERYEEQFDCGHCGSQGQKQFRYDFTSSGGEVWVCRNCKNELMVDELERFEELEEGWTKLAATKPDEPLTRLNTPEWFTKLTKYNKINILEALLAEFGEDHEEHTTSWDVYTNGNAWLNELRDEE